MAPTPASTPAASAALLCEKCEYIGAVTLVHFSADGSLLYVGVGSTLFLYETATGALVAQHDILARGILHGCDIASRPASAGHVGVFFGQKRVACFRSLPQTPADAAAQPTLQRLAHSASRATKVFSDWVFDVQLLTHDAASSSDASSFPLVAVGLAHNFVQIWDPAADRIVRSVQCAERCILYALSFHGRRLADLVVASGTVFQQILLWQPCARGSAVAEAPEQDAAVVAPSQRLHSHDGVLFKLEWSSDASMLASVSDDRTVQLWSSRDASAFPVQSASRSDSGFLATTEQTLEFMARLSETSGGAADIARPYRSVFRSWGHTARLWDVKFCAYGLVTTSEDAVCKLWDFAGNCIASLHGHMGRHVWRVAVHPSRAIVATGGSDSAVKLWNIYDQVKSTSSDASAFCESIALAFDDDPVPSTTPVPKPKSKSKSKTRSIRDIVVDQIHGDRAFVATERGQILAIDVPAQTSTLFYSLSSRDRAEDGTDAAPPMLSAFASDAHARMLLTGDSTGAVSVIDVATQTQMHEWRAHDSRVVKIVSVPNDGSSSSNGAPSTLLTVCADCTIREWQFEPASDGDGAATALIATYKSPGKCAASSLLVVDHATTRNIVCGDGRGNVFVFQRSLGATDVEAATVVQAPSLVLRSVHGREQVASLLRHDSAIYTGGHDGYICTLVASFSRDGALSLSLVGRESIKGMATVKQLWLSPRHELFVLGFYASYAILHNATAQLRLFNVECGGWRRPHALVTQDIHGTPSTPAHTFLFTPPVVNKTDALELKVHSTLTQRVAPAFASPPLRSSSLHYQYHGKMTTCVVHIGDRLVTAAEDNSVKLHVQQPRCALGSTAATGARWTCVSTGVAHTTTVRALTSFRVSGAHVLLSGGGKERINVWRVADGVDVIEHVCGFEKDDAVQDQRILGLATFAIRPRSDGVSAERYRLVAACNSEGAIQLLLLDVEARSLRELGHVSSSQKPILSCAGFQHAGVDKPDKIEDDAAAILAVGATDGVVTIWSFAGLVRELERMDLADPSDSTSSRSLARVLSYLVPIEAYDAHDMGVNCLAIAHADALSFGIVSGGDDQNMRLREYATGGESLELTCDARAVNASGSAIKAIYSDGAAVFLAGYDQRVSKWAIVSRDDSKDSSTCRKALVWQCAVFAECADIANLAVWSDSNTRDAPTYEVVAVGQGLQAMRFRK